MDISASLTLLPIIIILALIFTGFLMPYLRVRRGQARISALLEHQVKVMEDQVKEMVRQSEAVERIASALEGAAGSSKNSN
jgi:hypothetical protein